MLVHCSTCHPEAREAKVAGACCAFRITLVLKSQIGAQLTEMNLLLKIISLNHNVKARSVALATYQCLSARDMTLHVRASACDSEHLYGVAPH